MGLFTPDLYRNFAIGFLVGAVVIGASSVPNWETEWASPAQAATSTQQAGIQSK